MEFDYLEPRSVPEAISLLTEYRQDARILAGGTDLLLKMKRGSIKPKALIDVNDIPGLDEIRYDVKTGLSIGPLATIRSIEKSEVLRKRYSVISQAAEQLGSVGIRNIATVGGNLCNASPSADMAPPLIGLGAEAEIVGSRGERRVLLEDFFRGPALTALQTDEILVGVRVRPPWDKTHGVYLKYGIRGAIDLAIVSVAVIALTGSDGICEDIRIVLGAVAPVPMRAEKSEQVLRGNDVTRSRIEEAARLASIQISPISDTRASADYRGKMVQVFTRRALGQAFRKDFDFPS